MNMRRGILSSIIMGGIAAASALFVNARRSAPRQEAAQPARRPRAKRRPREAVMVRVTENGRKYHRDGCPLLHGASRTVPIAEAMSAYEPCKACHPPGLNA
jgi:hypothetical protein